MYPGDDARAKRNDREEKKTVRIRDTALLDKAKNMTSQSRKRPRLISWDEDRDEGASPSYQDEKGAPDSPSEQKRPVQPRDYRFKVYDTNGHAHEQLARGRIPMTLRGWFVLDGRCQSARLHLPRSGQPAELRYHGRDLAIPGSSYQYDDYVSVKSVRDLNSGKLADIRPDDVLLVELGGAYGRLYRVPSIMFHVQHLEGWVDRADATPGQVLLRSEPSLTPEARWIVRSDELVPCAFYSADIGPPPQRVRKPLSYEPSDD